MRAWKNTGLSCLQSRGSKGLLTAPGVQIWRYDADIGVKEVFSALRVYFSAPVAMHTLARMRARINYLLVKMAERSSAGTDFRFGA